MAVGGKKDTSNCPCVASIKKVTANSEKLPSFATVAVPKAGLSPAVLPLSVSIFPAVFGREALKRKKPMSPLNGPPLSWKQKSAKAGGVIVQARIEKKGESGSTPPLPFSPEKKFLTNYGRSDFFRPIAASKLIAAARLLA